MIKRLLSFCIFLTLLFLNSVQAANYYWVGGAGKWSEYNLHWAKSSGGNVFHAQVPTNLDNVYFNANSGFIAGNNTITIDQTIVYCKDMDWTGATTNPKIITTLSTNSIKIFGSLTLINAMNFSYTADISFESTVSGNTITSNGVVLPCKNVYLNGTGGAWTLNDSLTITNCLYHNSGTFNTNNKTITVGAYRSSTSNPRTLSLGSSIFKVNPITFPVLDTYKTHFSIIPTNFTLNAGTSIIQFIGNLTGLMNVFGLTFNSLISSSTANFEITAGSSTKFKKALLQGNTKLTGDSYSVRPIFDSLIFSPEKTYILDKYIGINTIGGFVANGTCSKPINIKGIYAGYKAYIVKAGTGVAVTNVTLKDIDVSGGATFSATSSFNLGNVSGWTNIINPSARNLYWIGGTGLWSDPSHWSLSSGGIANAGCIPFLSDDVFFDTNSGFTAGNTVIMDMQIGFCNSMDWTGAPNNPTFMGSSTNTFTIGGSLSFIQNMIYSFQGDVSFNATQTGKTITSANKVFNSSKVTFEGVGGGWILQDSLSGTVNTILNLYAGNLNTNSKNINVGSFNSSLPVAGITFPVKVLSLNNSRITITAPSLSWKINTNNFTLNAGTSTIILTSASEKYLITDAYNYYNVIVVNGPSQISGNGAFFHKLQLSSSGRIDGSNTKYDSLVLAAGNLYTFASASTHTLMNGTLVANGACSKPIYLQSSNPGQAFLLKKTTGTVQVDNVIMRDNIASGGATFIANNSFATPEVTGWTINAIVSRDLYWVGGTGVWNDSNHWSLTSGGANGACIPGPNDNVFFDANSFPTTGAIVTIQGWRAFCKNMDWTGSLRTPRMDLTTPLEIFGSLKMISAMNVSNYSNTTPYVFGAGSNVNITTAGHALSYVQFNGTNGTWNLKDNLTASMIFLLNGTLKTNNHDITTTYSGLSCSSSSVSTNKALYLGSSTVTLKNDLYLITSNFTLDAGTSTIVFTDAFDATVNLFCSPYGLNFHNVICQHGTKQFQIDGRNTFNKLTLQGPGFFNSSNTFDTLKLTPGRSYKFHSDSTQTIRANGQLDAMGTPGFPIEMISHLTGTRANIRKSTGTICLDYLFLKDINATGGAQFYAGTNGANVSNNSGWIFTACSPTGIEEFIDIAGINIYPVPIHGSFFIDMQDKVNAIVSIVDITGKKVKEFSISNVHNEINVDELTNGIYNLIITNGENLMSKKIIIY